PQAQEQARQALAHDVRSADEDIFELDEDPEVIPTPGRGMGTVAHGRLPVPEPEAQSSPRPSSDQRPQRPIRRLEQKGLDLPRSNRTPPSGDVIDIPAFLRKR